LTWLFSVISVCFEFHLFIDGDSFAPGRLFGFIFAHSWLKGALYFSLKNLF